MLVRHSYHQLGKIENDSDWGSENDKPMQILRSNKLISASCQELNHPYFFSE